jgi:solute carrier family 25 phosphate transporter 3
MYTESCELDIKTTWLPSSSSHLSMGVQRHHTHYFNPYRHDEREHDYHDGKSNPKNSSYYNLSLEHHHGHDWYYAKCLLGGGLSSSVRWMLTPLDFMKCNMQANPTRYPSFTAGLAIVYQKYGLTGLYRGFVPTVLAYSTQAGTKYACYEYFRDTINEMVGPHHAAAYKSLIYIISAGTAEFIADILYCPWEMLKVKMQTTLPTEFPTQFRPALSLMVQNRNDYRFPFGSLQPLWSRQVIGTIANFVTFEHTVNGIYKHILQTHNKDDYNSATQLGITFVAGYVSGLVSTVVSHPADSILSLQAKHPNKTFKEIVQLVGWKKLATQGLGPRVALTGTIIASQWLIYDAFKSTIGLGTSGGVD